MRRDDHGSLFYLFIWHLIYLPGLTTIWYPASCFWQRLSGFIWRTTGNIRSDSSAWSVLSVLGRRRGTGLPETEQFTDGLVRHDLVLSVPGVHRLLAGV